MGMVRASRRSRSDIFDHGVLGGGQGLGAGCRVGPLSPVRLVGRGQPRRSVPRLATCFRSADRSGPDAARSAFRRAFAPRDSFDGGVEEFPLSIPTRRARQTEAWWQVRSSADGATAGAPPATESRAGRQPRSSSRAAGRKTETAQRQTNGWQRNGFGMPAHPYQQQNRPYVGP
jgi:hypothetical protein